MQTRGEPPHENKKGQNEVPLSVLEEEDDGSINVAGADGWERIELTVDSGAAETICPAKSIPSVPTTPGVKFKQGARYTCANGKKLDNLGEKRCILATDESPIAHNLTMQVAEVNRAILSVSKAVDAGNRVIFDDRWSYIEDKRTGQRTALQRRGGLYVLESWVRARGEEEQPSASNRRPAPFGRPGVP